VPLHIAMLVFLLLLAVATAALSKRFAGGSAWPLLFVMLSPAVVVSTNVMRDVPVAALSTAAVALFVAGVDSRRWPLALAGCFVAGLAILTKYSAVAIVPLLALYPILQRRSRCALWLLIPIALLGLWCLHNQAVYGRLHIAYLMAERRGDLPWGDRFYAGLVVLGACLFLAPALFADALRRGRVLLAAGALLAAGLAIYGARLHNEGPIGWQHALWVTTGAALAFLAIIPGLLAAPRALRLGSGQALSRDREDAAATLFLALWACAVIGFSVFFTIFQAVRHLIPAVVPLALLAVRLMRPPAARSRWLPALSAVEGTALLGVLLAAQAILAFAVAAADYEYANTYRDFAHKARHRFVAQTRQIWFSGNWGWQRYARSAGFRMIAEHGPAPPPGAVVLIPDRVHKGGLPEGLELDEIEEKTYSGRIPIHTMDGSVGASFYAVVGRSVPYAFTQDRALETFRVFHVKHSPR
jgi:4-amino-4-deoxy-L-arabinose transferase-like glycosyltransferase